MNLSHITKWARKADSWIDESIPVITAQHALVTIQQLIVANELLVFPTTREAYEDFEGPRPQFFVAQLENGDRFLVDSQGYNYPRYVARIGVPQLPASEFDQQVRNAAVYAVALLGDLQRHVQAMQQRSQLDTLQALCSQLEELVRDTTLAAGSSK